MAVRKIPLEDGGYIKFDNDEEYFAYLKEQEYLKQQEKQKRRRILKIKIIAVGIIVFVLAILFMILKNKH